MPYLLLPVLMLWFSFTTVAAAVPQVAVSIKPLYDLTTVVMHGVAQPVLIIPPRQSPHSFSLKPSMMKQISQAKLLIWVGGGLEQTLEKVVQQVSEANRLTVMEIEGLKRLPVRENADWGVEEHDKHHQHDAHEEHPEPTEHQHAHHAHDQHEGMDPHIWLSPDNAIRIVNEISRKLSRLDPANQAVYADNAKAFGANIEQQIPRWHKILEGVKDKPYLVLHDAYAYLEDFFSLSSRGAVLSGNSHLSSIKRVKQLRSQLQQQQIRCVFAEPQFDQRTLHTLTENSRVKIATLDPLGSTVDGTDAYQQLLEDLIRELRNCLQ